ncbi:MAG: alpha-1,2-fucosyltransferase [Muribaculaceae bacterium]|nr:alpha-1,2-fucosyltransferase [Muribaculaceae bacterium]
MNPFASKCVGLLGRTIYRLGLLKTAIYIEMDGGICSQMHFYMAGRMLERQGHKVIFELKWFDECGLDTDGRFARCFDLQKAFPTLPIHTCHSGIRSLLFRKSWPRAIDWFDKSADPLEWLSTTPPAYIMGYFHDTEEMYGSLFRDTFCVDTTLLDDENRAMLRQIEASSAACAMHVRRGDLATFNPAYGAPADIDYFNRAIREMKKAGGDGMKFYIFSDEPEWCCCELIPQLDPSDFTVCDLNGSDRGWCDLVLMSRCPHHITSQGSLGKYAALLRPDQMEEGLVTLLPQCSEWAQRFSNTKII